MDWDDIFIITLWTPIFLILIIILVLICYEYRVFDTTYWFHNTHDIIDGKEFYDGYDLFSIGFRENKLTINREGTPIEIYDYIKVDKHYDLYRDSKLVKQIYPKKNSVKIITDDETRFYFDNLPK